MEFIPIFHTIMKIDCNTDIKPILHNFIDWIHTQNNDSFHFIDFINYLQHNHRNIYAYHLIPFAVAFISKILKEKQISIKQYPDLCYSLNTNDNYEH